MAIFYVIKHISRKHFVSLQRYKIKKRCKNPLSETRRAQKNKNYEKECKRKFYVTVPNQTLSGNG